MAKKEEAVKKDETESQEEKKGFNFQTFFQETKDELAKVVWPSRQQLFSESAAVLLMVILSATLIYLIDGLFSWASSQVFS